MDMLLLVIGFFIFAGLVKGTLGLGLPTVAMGLMSMVISPFQAAALLIVPSMMLMHIIDQTFFENADTLNGF